MGLLIAMLLTILPISAFEVDGIYYEIISVGNLTCGVTNVNNVYTGHLDIPSTVTYRDRHWSVVEVKLRYCDLIESISIPNGVTDINFEGCKNLKSVTIPNSVTHIYYKAFADCSSLTEVTIPNSVTYIGEAAFAGCSSLTEVTIPNSVTYIGSSAFARCSSLTEVTIPNSVTYIGHSAFSNCSSLKYISLSDNMTMLEYGMFRNCSSLESLEIPGSIKQIQQYWLEKKYETFENCHNLMNLKLLYSTNTLSVVYQDEYINFHTTDWDNWTNTIKNLYIDRFINRDIPVPNLEKLELGESITKVQVEGIKDLKNLKIIESHALIPPRLPHMSNDQYMDVLVIVPDEALDAYKSDPIWGSFWNLQGSSENGIESVREDSVKQPIGKYNISGNSMSDNYKGLVIIRYSDGSTKKIIQK